MEDPDILLYPIFRIGVPVVLISSICLLLKFVFDTKTIFILGINLSANFILTTNLIGNFFKEIQNQNMKKNENKITKKEAPVETGTDSN